MEATCRRVSAQHRAFTKIRQEYGRRSESEVVGDEASWKYRAAA